MARVLVLGAGGMAGHISSYYLSSLGHVVFAAARKTLPNPFASMHIDFDARRESDLPELLRTTAPEVVVNCIGVLVRESEKSPENAILLNALLPRRLAALSDEYGYRLIHISTDCVFSGKSGMYVETDFRDGDDVYARTKALGEIDDSRNATIRTSIVGPELKKEGKGLLHWFLSQKGPINGYINHLWSGVTTLELAKTIAFIIENPISGIVHLSNGLSISKYELLQSFNEIWRAGKIEILPTVDTKAINKSIISKRPDFLYAVPAYSSMFVDLYEQMREIAFVYKPFYGEY